MHCSSRIQTTRSLATTNPTWLEKEGEVREGERERGEREVEQQMCQTDTKAGQVRGGGGGERGRTLFSNCINTSKPVSYITGKHWIGYGIYTLRMNIITISVRSVGHNFDKGAVSLTRRD